MGSEMCIRDSYTTVEVVEGIEAYMKQYGIENVTELVGAVT